MKSARGRSLAIQIVIDTPRQITMRTVFLAGNNTRIVVIFVMTLLGFIVDEPIIIYSFVYRMRAVRKRTDVCVQLKCE